MKNHPPPDAAAASQDEVSSCSSKRKHADGEKEEDDNPNSKMKKKMDVFPSPPEDDERLGDYFQEDWFLIGLDEQSIQDFQDDLGRKIGSLRRNPFILKYCQEFLKTDLKYFLLTGDAVDLDRVRDAQERVAVMDYDILQQDGEVLYQRDVLAFKERVEALFPWWNTYSSYRDDFLAPYFPLIQSRGTGKTKLMHACKQMFDETNDVHCELILCHGLAGANVTTKCSTAAENSVFSQTLDVWEYYPSDKNRVELWDMLNTLVKRGGEKKKKVVLFFDEAQHLLERHQDNSWHFRTIRWWLRSPRVDHKIVCVFAGTNLKLADHFTEPRQSYTSRDVVIPYNEGTELYPPFWEITTTGLVSRTDRSSIMNAESATRETGNDGATEFDVAVPYGRPLFARMHQRGALKRALGPILLRLRGLTKDADMTSVEQDFSILATRLQMGHVPFRFASKQVASGYAHLIHFTQDLEPVAEIAYLPDPVCAWLAMTQMIKECTLFKTVRGIEMPRSEPPSVWSEKAIKIYSSGLCHPEKGTVGPVAAAFYMLACGDELRLEESKELTKLSVPLESWIKRLQGNHEGDDNAQTEGPTVNFIQVCRNYLRPSLKEMQDSGLLEHWYRGARASYADASGTAYDLIVPVKYKADEGYGYCPMLVSVENRSSFNDAQREAAINEMKSALERDGVKIGMCMLVLFGLEDQSLSLKQQTTEIELCTDGKNLSSVVIEVPKEDDYGATNLALCSTCGGGERSEVFASHADVALVVAGKSFEGLLRSKTNAADPSAELLKDIGTSYNKVLQHDDSE